MKTRMNSTICIICTCLALVLLQVSSVTAAPLSSTLKQNDAETVIAKGFEYIQTQMNDDGGIRWTDESSNVAATLRVVLALAASNYPQGYLKSDSGNRPIDFLMEVGPDWIAQSEAVETTIDIARTGQLLTAVAAANENPFAFGVDSLNLVNLVTVNYDAGTGVFGQSTVDNVLDQAWAILGLAASSASIPVESVEWLVGAQLEDGSWNDGYDSFLDTTPIALMALIASGYGGTFSSAVQAAMAFMQANQDFDGGWLTAWDTVTNADTTSMMLQAISSLGQLPMDEAWQQHDGNPFTALLAIQKEDGSIGNDYANSFSTADAILGLSGQPLYNLSTLHGVTQAFNFLFDAQNNDGGWGNVGQTIDAILAIRAAGWDPQTVVKGGAAPLSYIADNMTSYLDSGPDAIGKTILGIAAAGRDPSDFECVNLVALLMDTYDRETGTFGTSDNTWHQAFAILGLNAASADIPQAAVDSLVNLQQGDGGWEYAAGFGTWPDNTALAVQALVVAGVAEDDPVIQSALTYLQSQQTNNGNWGDSSTTAYVIMALNALNSAPEDWIAASGKTPLSSLFSYQKSNGSFVYTWEYSDDSILSTTVALLVALSGDLCISSPDSIEVHYAGLVLDPGNGEVTTVCVPFKGDSLTGTELLESSGIAFDAQEGFMNSIMEIENPQGETLYWSYWYFDGREWAFQMTGSGESLVLPGSIEGWHFTSWEIFPSLPLDVIPDLSEICEMEVLKDYRVQPYLSFGDLTKGVIDPEPSTGSQNEPGQVSTTGEALPSEEAKEEDSDIGIVEEDQVSDLVIDSELPIEERSEWPFYIIIVFGVVLAAVTYIFVLKKKA